MSESIYFDGVEFISATDAAREGGFTRDYIARLCREEKIMGKRVGKQWYVHHLAFKKFLLEQESAKVVRS